MSQRYRVILEQSPEGVQKIKALEALAKHFSVKIKDAEEWVQHLPLTLASNSSEQSARKLIQIFSALGAKLGTVPVLSAEEKSSAARWDQELVLGGQKTEGANSGYYVSVTVIAIIISIFIGSLYFAYRTISHLKPNAEIKAETLSKDPKEKSQQLQSKAASRLPALSLGVNKPEHMSEVRQTRAMLEEALKLNPSNQEALKSLGILNLQEGLLEQAREYFIRALAHEPKNVVLLNYMAVTLMQDRSIDSASEILERALAVEPENWLSNKNMATVKLFYQSDTILALVHYRRYLKNAPDNEGEMTYIKQTMLKILWNQAFPVPTLILTFSEYEQRRVALISNMKKKESAELLFQLGQLYVSHGIEEEAVHLWRRAAQKESGDLEINTALVRLEGKLEYYSSARKLALRQTSNDTYRRELVLAIALLNRYYKNDSEAAKQYYTRYINFGNEPYRSLALQELQSLK